MKLRYLVTIEQKSIAKDSFGALQETWSTFAQVYAGFQTMNGMEPFAAQKLSANVTHTIVIRFRSGVLPTMRVNWQDSKENRARIFEIIDAIDSTQRRRELHLHCVERNIPNG